MTVQQPFRLVLRRKSRIEVCGVEDFAIVSRPGD
jgi:hypothetical protein